MKKLKFFQWNSVYKFYKKSSIIKHLFINNKNKYINDDIKYLYIDTKNIKSKILYFEIN